MNKALPDVRTGLLAAQLHALATKNLRQPLHPDVQGLDFTWLQIAVMSLRGVVNKIARGMGCEPYEPQNDCEFDRGLQDMSKILMVKSIPKVVLCAYEQILVQASCGIHQVLETHTEFLNRLKAAHPGDDTERRRSDRLIAFIQWFMA